MSDTHIQTISHAEPFKEARSRRRSWARWLRWILLALVSLWLVGLAITLAIEFTGLHRMLTARLESAFGRPVKVRAYDFSFWGPVVEARSVTVGEDPRFGHEYFLRADSMTLRLRWQSLLRGRIELGTLSLTHPSLNLVRNAAGQWNLAEWLPRPTDSSPALGANRPSRIAIDSGRINFKRGDDKLPVAFVSVNGSVETDSPGRWRIDLDATPWRAAVILQQAGDLHVSGYIGGTSSRLRPAALDLSWTDASLSDFLRLVRGDDSGIRGGLALTLAARTPDESDGSWSMQGRAALRQIHRWDMALRPDNPSVNLIVQTKWSPASLFLDLPSIALEASRSNARGSGQILWNRDQPLKASKPSPVQFVLSSAQIDLADVLAWLRAFHPGIADQVSLRGLVSARGALYGWSPNLATVSLSSDGIDFLGGALLKPVHLGPFEFRYSQGAISSTPVTLAWGARARSPDGSFRVDLSTRNTPKASPAWRISGNSTQMRDLIAAAGAFGWNISRGWVLSGPLACDLRWPSAEEPWRTEPVGWLDFGAAGDGRGASLTAPFLNQPVEQIRAHVDLKPGDVRHIELSSAAAFGARWSGMFDRRAPAAEWQFALSANSLDAADLDRWLNPVWREDFLGRMLPFLAYHPAENAVPENLRATGHLNLAEFNLGSLAVSNLKGSLAVEGRHLSFTNASGQFSLGVISGSIDADLQAVPSYRAVLSLSDVEVSALSAASPQLADLFAGSLSGHASLHAAGANRSDLLASLECSGTASVTHAVLRHMNLLDSLREATLVPGRTALEQASGSFSCHKRQIEIEDLRLVHANDEIDASGSVDFRHDLDLRLRVPLHATADFDVVSPPENPWVEYHVTGTLAAPQIAPIATPHSRAGR